MAYSIPTKQADFLQRQREGVSAPHLVVAVGDALRPVGRLILVRPLAAYPEWHMFSVKLEQPALVQDVNKGVPSHGVRINEMTGAVTGYSPPLAMAALPQAGDDVVHILVRMVVVPTLFRVSNEDDLLSTVRCFAAQADAWYYLFSGKKGKGCQDQLA